MINRRVNNHGVFDIGNDLDGATAMSAAFSINAEYLFQPLSQVMAMWRSPGVLF